MNEFSAQYALTTKLRESLQTELYRGYRKADGAPVMVKRLRGSHPAPLELARLRHEYGILQSLSDPRVVRPLELERCGHGLALVVEDVGDASLDQLIACGHLSLERCLQLAVALAQTVAAVHRHRIVHKDIKPQHFFVKHEDPNTLVLVDLGSASNLSHQIQATAQPTELEGTLGYIAPEQTGRMNRVVDRRSDLYSLGVTLYELFTGHLPFDGTDPLDLVHSHIARTPLAPRLRRADLPPIISDIIMRLLAKAAEERYQSAASLQRDLEHCLTQLASLGHIDAFVLGEHDCSGELALAQKLYGRDKELATLLSGLERVRGGRRLLLLLSGAAGVGKSALVGELQRHLERGDSFVSGKFDFLGASVPYAPIAQALRELVRSVLAAPPAKLAERKQALLEALGPNGQLLIELVPELEIIVGKQPSVPALGPSESQHRFASVFSSFLRTFTASGHPLVLFLDDLQWADAASLWLLQHAMTAQGFGGLLIIGAYRKTEVSAAHPLALTLQELQRADATVEELSVEPLGLAHITELLHDTLGRTAAPAAELASVLLDKTRGNPFFLNQFLGTLHRDGLLAYSHEERAWHWDLRRVAESLATDNVVDFMLSRVRELPATTQEMLLFAACIGHQFDGQTLATVCQRSGDEVKCWLWNAVQQGLLVPLDDNYRYGGGADADGSDGGASALNAAYRFLHDRVHQAAYSLISEEQRAPVHLSIGRLLLSRANDEPTDADLFEVTDHLNRGLSCISDSSERLRLARLNLAAGRRARHAAAPGSAIRYLGMSLSLLGAAPLAERYELAWPAYLLKAECEYLIGNLDEALRLLRHAETQAHSPLEKVAARNLELTVLYKTGDLEGACRRAADTVRLLGITLPEFEDKVGLNAAIGAAFAGYRASIAGRDVATLDALPPMTEPDQLALLETLATGIPAAYGSNTELHVLLVLRGVQLLSQATAPLAAFFYEQYAIVHAVITGELDEAFRYGQLGIELAKQGGDPRTIGQVYFLFGGFTAHWRRHISVALELLGSALRLSLEVGDRLYAVFAASFAVNYRLYAGENLDDVQGSIDAAREVADQAGDPVHQTLCQLCQQAVHALQGKTDRLASLSSGDFSESKFEAGAPISTLPLYGTVKAMLRYLAGESREALDAADRWPIPPGMFCHGEHALYRALAAADLACTAGPEERSALVERARRDAKTIAGWAKCSPANHAHRVALVRAELAALGGEQGEAIDLYDQAIRLAQENGFMHQEALANELAGRFHWSHGRKKLAASYLFDAVLAYQRWGAGAKVKALRDRYPELLREARSSAHLTSPPLAAMARTSRMATRLSIEPASSAFDSHRRLDLTTAIRATEAIATELVVERLWERLMRTLIEHAGAQRCCVILERAGGLSVEATVTIDPDTVRLGLAEELDNAREVPPSLVQYVARTSDTVVLADATRDPRFGSDPYFVRARPKSVLCAAMLQRGQLSGVLYLENNTATKAFSPARVELLQFLATQAAVAFENAKLYSDLEAASGALRRANERLENQVAHRTVELRRTLSELWSEMDLARKIQTVLLPKQTKLRDYEVAAAMLPAESVGGDYYDIIETGGRDWILIGDVSGHGVTAGLIMMMIQTAVRAIVLTTPLSQEILSPATVLSRVNRAVRDNLQRVSPEQYMTIMALELDGGMIRFAGHHQDILVYRSETNTVQRVETRGMWLGIEDDISHLLEDARLELEPGDLLLLYTDGITEFVLDGQMQDVEGLSQRFHTLASQHLEPAAIVKGILGPLSGKTAADDMTVVVVRYSPNENLDNENHSRSRPGLR